MKILLKYLATFAFSFLIIFTIFSCAAESDDPNVYKISYNDEKASSPLPDKNVVEGTKLGPEELPVQTETGYVFKGWYLADEDGNYLLDENKEEQPIRDGYVINSNIILKAKWEAVKYTIKFDKNGGTGSEIQKIVSYGEIITIPENRYEPPSEYKRRDGWIDTPSFIEGQTKQYKDGDKVPANLWLPSNPDDPKILYAYYRKGDYIVRFYDKEGEDKTTLADMDVLKNTALKTTDVPEYPKKDHYVFEGWKKEGSEDSPVLDFASYLINGDINFFPKYKRDTHIITFSSEYSSNTLTASSKVVECQTELKDEDFEPLENDNYTFFGWYEGETKVECPYKVEKDTIFTAKWEKKPILSFETEHGSLNTSSVKLEYGKEFSDFEDLTGTDEEYTFLGWYIGREPIDTSKPYTATETVKFTAKWEKKPVITFTSPYSQESLEIQTKIVEYGDIYTAFETLEDANHTFKGWMVNNELIGNSYKIEGDVTFTAKWEKKATLTFESDHNATLGFTTKKIDRGVAITSSDLPTVSANGYKFDKWVINNSGSDAVGYTVTDDVTIKATWTPYKITITFEPNSPGVTIKNKDGTPAASYTETFEYEIAKKFTKCPFYCPGSSSGNSYKSGGYYFAGWTTQNGTEAKYTDEADYTWKSEEGETVTSNSTLTLYALWKERTDLIYIVSFENPFYIKADLSLTANETRDLTLEVSAESITNDVGGITYNWYIDGNTAKVIQSGTSTTFNVTEKFGNEGIGLGKHTVTVTAEIGEDDNKILYSATATINMILKSN